MEPEIRLKCPNCGLELFALRTAGHGLVIIRVEQDGTIVAQDLDPALLTDADKEVVYCLNCGWSGAVSELVGEGF